MRDVVDVLIGFALVWAAMMCVCMLPVLARLVWDCWRGEP